MSKLYELEKHSIHLGRLCNDLMKEEIPFNLYGLASCLEQHSQRLDLFVSEWKRTANEHELHEYANARDEDTCTTLMMLT